MRNLLISSAIVLGSASAHATLYTFDWNPSTPGGGTNSGAGSINSIHSTFNTSNNELSWYANLGKSSSPAAANGFTLVLSGGPNPKGQAGQLAIFYFDATKGAITAYGYNGRNDASSWNAGKSNGTGAADKIWSSVNDSGLIDYKSQVNGDGSKTLGFKLNATKIQNHIPLFPETGPWEGTKYGSKVGVWFHPYQITSSSYSKGYLSKWSTGKSGWLDGENFPTTQAVPEPGTIALIGAGLVALRRRKKA